MQFFFATRPQFDDPTSFGTLAFRDGLGLEYRNFGFHYSIDLRTQTYTKPVPLTYGNHRHKISVDIRIFLQCITDFTQRR